MTGWCGHRIRLDRGFGPKASGRANRGCIGRGAAAVGACQPVADQLDDLKAPTSDHCSGEDWSSEPHRDVKPALQVAFDELPVRQIFEKAFHEIRAPVLEIQIIGLFPCIDR